MELDKVAPRKLIGLTDTTALLGKAKAKPFLDSHTIKPPGKPTLASADDPRPPIRDARLDFADDTETPDA
jgi:hypothetical protein